MYEFTVFKKPNAETPQWQPGKDKVHSAYGVDDLGIGVDQGWVKTAISLRHENPT